MVGKVFEYTYDRVWLAAVRDWCATNNSSWRPEETEPAIARDDFRKHHGPSAATEVRKVARASLDRLLTSRGDDGVLEHLRETGRRESGKPVGAQDRSAVAAGSLAGALLEQSIAKA
jgi:hypothetical protein